MPENREKIGILHRKYEKNRDFIHVFVENLMSIKYFLYLNIVSQHSYSYPNLPKAKYTSLNNSI